ncbi:uncharacterized protein LOC111921737 [Lactuca sativa]|uniref:Methyltransferase-like protein 13 n=1 Tax=Lactuca sativa TaxID=4236 RepID=A0A9R1WD37_LACSA|nr:uncharacterized protein LOC111921737 [Lactuca sativa]KAJ0223036.1 hypothetical protein LSAT_V11C200088320 [Lactuca sativa]
MNDPIFKTLTPSQFITFTVPNPVNHPCYLNTPRLRVAVLDSPVAVAADYLPKVAAMIVPDQRETDWNFCTESGHLQLLFNIPGLSRLILIGNDLPPNPEPPVYIRPPVTDTVDREKLEDEIQPLVMALHPKVCFQKGLPNLLFLTYEDDVLYRVIIARFVGPFVGEFVVEDVEMESNNDSDKKLRRRLRFKRMPNLIQSQVPLIPILDDGQSNTKLDLESLRKMKNAKFDVDTTVLVHPYLTPMVSGLFLIASHLNERIQQGFTSRALCLGVGGGALLSFLNTQMEFEVVGVEADEAVLSAAKQYFGLNNGKSIQLIVGDAIEVIQNFATKGDTDDSQVSFEGLDDKFDVVMADLDSSEARNGISAPPPEFIKKSVFQAVRLLLHDHGVLIINVVPQNEVIYMKLVQELKDAFHKVYGIDVGNQDNFVLVATLSPSSSNDHENAFLKRLRSVIQGAYMDSIVEL